MNNSGIYPLVTERSLVGIFDMRRAQRVGELILFLEDLAQLADSQDIVGVEVVVIREMLKTELTQIDIPAERLIETATGYPLIDLLAVFAIVQRIRVLSGSFFHMILNSERNLVWPQFPDLSIHNYDTTIRIQQRYREGSRVVPLELCPDVSGWARKLTTDLGPAPCIAVHLKNDPLGADESNANFDAWREFFRRASKESPVKFVIIGDDVLDEQMLDCSNVIRAAERPGASLGGYLAIIKQSSGFMGMMSGFCNIAILGGRPYSIFKNPKHHSEAMLAEIGQNDHYVFSIPGQRILREKETSELLWSEFQNLSLLIAASGPSR